MVGEDSRLPLEGAVWAVRVPCSEDLVIVLGCGYGGKGLERETV